LVQEAHRRLIEIVKLIEENHGRNKVTPNLHLSLHLAECSYDYGPLYAFWCFTFERMNGILGNLPNSNRQIEPELMRRLMFDNQIDSIISSGVATKGLDLLNRRPSVGSLSDTDQYSSDEIYRFQMNSQNILESQISGSEQFPGEFLKPTSDNVIISNEMIDLIIEYYSATYTNFKFRKPFGKGPKNSIIIGIKFDKFGRCRISSELFGLTMSLRHVKSSYILAKFITNNGSVDYYPGQVQYYFTHTVNLSNGKSDVPAKHFLAYVRWYQPADSSNIRYYFSINEEQFDEDTCNVELWSNEFYPESRDCIIPVHHILGRFVPVTYRISNRRNAREYLAINPINRKYHL